MNTLSEQDLLLDKLKTVAEKHVDKYVISALEATAQNGIYGMEMVDLLHSKLPRTTCGNCGKCCNSVSIYSLEYHRIMREIMANWKPERIRRLVKSIMDIKPRMAEAGNEKRLRCIFRDDITKVCLIHPVRPFPCRFFGLLKEDGKRECPNVVDLSVPEQVVKEEYITNIQTKLLENSESFEPYAGKGDIHFFPFEFWFFRYVFSPERALQIYREILVPASTPLKNMWEKQESLKPITPADYEN